MYDLQLYAILVMKKKTYYTYAKKKIIDEHRKVTYDSYMP